MTSLQRNLRTLIKTSHLKHVVRLDHKFTSQIHDWVYNHSLFLHTFMIIRILLNAFGLPFFALIAIKYIKNNNLLFKIFIVWLLAELTIELIIKPFFARLRPECHTQNITIGPLHFAKPQSFSFPSGHSFNAGYIMILTWLLPIPLKIPITLTAMLVAFSRIALGFHYIVDVIVGLLIGLLLGYVALII